MSKQLANCSKSKRKRSDDGGRNLKHQSDQRNRKPRFHPSKNQTRMLNAQPPKTPTMTQNKLNSELQCRQLTTSLWATLLSDNEDAELENKEDDSTHSDSDEEGEWKVKKGNRARSSTKQSIPTASNSTQLPAIRFFISTRAIESFKSSIAIAKEIDKCMSSNKLKLKFASIKGNILMMATDDPATHERLNGQWPENAFIHGVKPLDLTKKASTRTKIVKGVDPSVDLSDEYLVGQLKNAGLTLVKRIFNKKTNNPTSIVKLSTSERQAFTQAINQGVRIGYQTFKAEPEHRTLQCYKCQKAGHSAWNCTNAQVCLKCSGQHSHKDCNATELKCANCNQSHAACSRQCKELQPPAKSKTNQTINKSYAKVVSNKCDLTATNKSPTLEQAVLEQLKEFVTTSIEAKIKEMTALVIDHISNVLSCFTGNLGVSPGDINKTNNNKMETNNNNNSELINSFMPQLISISRRLVANDEQRVANSSTKQLQQANKHV